MVVMASFLGKQTARLPWLSSEPKRYLHSSVNHSLLPCIMMSCRNVSSNTATALPIFEFSNNGQWWNSKWPKSKKAKNVKSVNVREPDVSWPWHWVTVAALASGSALWSLHNCQLSTLTNVVPDFSDTRSSDLNWFAGSSGQVIVRTGTVWGVLSNVLLCASGTQLGLYNS